MVALATHILDTSNRNIADAEVWLALRIQTPPRFTELSFCQNVRVFLARLAGGPDVPQSHIHIPFTLLPHIHHLRLLPTTGLLNPRAQSSITLVLTGFINIIATTEMATQEVHARRIPKAQWESQKARIKQYYIGEKQSVKEVHKSMVKNHEFQATYYPQS